MEYVAGVGSSVVERTTTGDPWGTVTVYVVASRTSTGPCDSVAFYVVQLRNGAADLILAYQADTPIGLEIYRGSASIKLTADDYVEVFLSTGTGGTGDQVKGNYNPRGPENPRILLANPLRPHFDAA